MTRSTCLAVAADHPTAMLPCPHCAASVRGENLERHLARTHAGVDLHAAAPRGLQLVGADRRMPFVTGALLVALPVATLIASWPMTDATMSVWVPVLGILAGLHVAALLGVFRARVELEGDALRLRWACGLMGSTVRLPGSLESGRTMERRVRAPVAADVDTGADDVAVGAYLRVANGHTSITLGAAKTATLAAHWAAPALRAGAPRRRWDVTVDRSAFTALTYELAARGLLRPRSSS